MMKRNFLFVVATAGLLTVSAHADKSTRPTPSDAFFTTPQAAYLEAYQEEILEAKKTEALQKDAVAKREKEEARKYEFERDIAAKKMQIENFRQSQVRLESEMKQSSVDIEGYQKDLELAEQEYKSFQTSADNQLVQADQQRKDLMVSRKSQEEATEKHRAMKAALNKALYDKKIEIQQMNAELALADAKAESLEAQNSNLKADEAKIQMELMAMKTSIQDKKSEIAKLYNDLDASKKKLEQARSDYFASSLEYKKTEARKDEVERQVMADVRKNDEAALAAVRSKSINESEKIRLEAEIEKLKSYLAAVKKGGNEVLDASLDAQASVMESRLTLQTIRSELVSKVAAVDRASAKVEGSNARLRKLASLGDNGNMKSWVVGKACELHKRASSKSETVSADISVGQKLVGSDYSKNWVKVMNSSGGPAFMRKECGSFE